MTNMHEAFSRSRMELVIAPEPKTSDSAATVEEWHNLAQLSTLLVFNTTRANFCMM